MYFLQISDIFLLFLEDLEKNDPWGDYYVFTFNVVRVNLYTITTEKRYDDVGHLIRTMEQCFVCCELQIYKTTQLNRFGQTQIKYLYYFEIFYRPVIIFLADEDTLTVNCLDVSKQSLFKCRISMSSCLDFHLRDADNDVLMADAGGYDESYNTFTYRLSVLAISAS